MHRFCHRGADNAGDAEEGVGPEDQQHSGLAAGEDEQQIEDAHQPPGHPGGEVEFTQIDSVGHPGKEQQHQPRDMDRRGDKPELRIGRVKLQGEKVDDRFGQEAESQTVEEGVADEHARSLLALVLGQKVGDHAGITVEPGGGGVNG